MTRLSVRPFWTSASQVLLGSAGVVLLTFVCYRLQFNLTIAVLADLVVIVLLSLGGNFLAAALVSLLAALSLSFFFTTPLFRLHVVDSPVDLVALAVFLTTALVVSRLVSSLRQALQRVQAAKEVLRQRAGLLDLTHDSIFVRDLNDVIRYWNRGAAELYGWSAEEVLGKVTHDILQASFPAPLDEIREELFRTGRWEGQLQHSKRDGTRVVVASRWSLQRDERGLPSAILESNNDITARVRAEAELRESERRYRRIFQTAAVSIWEEDFSQVAAAIDELKGQGVTDFRQYLAAHPEFVQRAISLVKIVDVNEATLTLLRAQSKEELLVSLERVFLPETQAVFAEELIALAQGKSFFQDETVLQTLQGDRVAVLFTIAFPPPPAPLDSVLISIMDVSERQRAEDALRRGEAYLAEAQRLSHTGSWARNLKRAKESYWSDEAYRIFGVDPRGDPATVDREMRERVHPEDWPRLQEAGERAIRNRTDFEVDYRAVLPNGSIRYIHAVGHPVTDSAGNVVELIGTVIDVTERKRTERALRRARERTLQARFAAVLNERTRLAREIHDTLLQGFTGVALKLLAASNRVTAPPESVMALREVVALAQKTLTDARRAVWDLRTPSPPGGTFPAALRTAAEDCVRDTGLALEYDVSGAMQPVDPEIEAVALRVVQESITNVVKHAAAHTVRVQLSFEERGVRLAIADDGRGFIVDPDFGTYGGHWGLLGMRERTSQVRGKLSVRSALGKGAEIVVLLPYLAPRVPAVGYRAAEPAADEPAGDLEPSPLQGASRTV